MSSDRRARYIQHLKDELGNRSNASSEIEYTGTRGWLVGDEGHGIATAVGKYCVCKPGANAREALKLPARWVDDHRAMAAPATAEVSPRYFRFDAMSEPERVRMRKTFAAAEPFPHIVVENSVAIPAAEVLEAYPPPDWPGWSRFRDAYQAEKRTCDDIDRIPAPLRGMIEELHAPAFLRFLEQVTGIERLLPDPYLEGAGLHCSGPGGVLAPHTDFHYYTRLGLYRRVNVIVYLNPDWKESDGGCLELYRGDAEASERTVVPRFGTCAIFRTDDRSVHGFPRAVAEGRWRRSIALYYYTAAEAEEFSGDTTTYWRQHGNPQGTARLRMMLYRIFLRCSSGFSRLAHRLNPTLALAISPRLGAKLGGVAGLAAGLGLGGALAALGLAGLGAWAVATLGSALLGAGLGAEIARRSSS